MFYQTQTAHKLPEKPKMPFFVPGDLYLWPSTCPNKGPNTSSMWIWCKSVSAVPGIFHTQTKNADFWRRQKQKLPQFTACGNNLSYSTFCLLNTMLYSEYNTIDCHQYLWWRFVNNFGNLCAQISPSYSNKCSRQVECMLKVIGARRL